MAFPLGCMLVSLVTAAPIATGAEDLKPPSARQGFAISEKLCKACHLISAESTGTAQVGPPSFANIANKPGQTAQHITNVLIQPHAPMPDMHLSTKEILNIISYLETLRTDRSAPSMLPPTGGGKPKSPAPS